MKTSVAVLCEFFGSVAEVTSLTFVSGLDVFCFVFCKIMKRGCRFTDKRDSVHNVHNVHSVPINRDAASQREDRVLCPSLYIRLEISPALRSEVCKSEMRSSFEKRRSDPSCGCPKCSDNDLSKA